MGAMKDAAVRDWLSGPTAQGWPRRRPPPPRAQVHRQTPDRLEARRQRPTFARVYVGDGNALELVSLHVTVTIEGPRPAPSSITSSAIRTTASSKAPSSIRCRPAPAPAISPCSSARPATPCRRASPAAARLPPLPADALAALPPDQLVKQRQPRRLGHVCRKPASSARTRPSKPTRTSSAAGSIRPCSNTPAATPSAAASSPSRPRATTASSSPTRNCCPSAGDQVLYRFPLPDCKLAGTAVHPARPAPRECKDAALQARRREEDRGRRPASPSRKTWTDKGPGGEVVFACTPPQSAHPGHQRPARRRTARSTSTPASGPT